MLYAARKRVPSGLTSEKLLSVYRQTQKGQTKKEEGVTKGRSSKF